DLQSVRQPTHDFHPAEGPGMTSRLLLLTGLVLLAGPLHSGADELQKLRSRGAEVYYLDQDLRAAFLKANPNGLPEVKRKLPKANIPLAYRAIAWGQVEPGKVIPTPAQIKQALLEQGPLVVSVHTTPLFEKYRGGVFQEHFKPGAGEAPSNHSAVIVGWDDRKG